ncbi:hypothetical protein CHU95_00330 [Niveispirillum lacus]|uniref:SAM-dependent methyltransferase n=1 Tax=Niveispirillum lacus TaxID=1981099 RepID=A0A255Z8N6_9PROT|nr:class I SAM-dependent methyltransferase [Niveispirillum lacus]OYQ37792.1 hypothetical protein CHU95_00330 [Niveispirillum lacus]
MASVHHDNKAHLDSWYANASNWSKAIADGAIPSRRLVTDQAIISAILEGPATCILDVGCGEGWLARALTAQGRPVVGVDAVPALIDKCRALAGGVDTYHVASYADIIADPDRIGSGFDLIVMNFALMDEDPRPLLSALRRIAAPGGRMLIQTLHPGSLDGPYENGWRTETFVGFEGEANWTPMPWYFRTIASWVDAVATDWHLTALKEPLNPVTRKPASLILMARA